MAIKQFFEGSFSEEKLKVVKINKGYFIADYVEILRLVKITVLFYFSNSRKRTWRARFRSSRRR